MHRLTSLKYALFAALAAAAAGCGGSKPAEAPKAAEAETSADATGAKAKKDEGAADAKNAGAEKKDECLGFDIANLEDVLIKSACEESEVRPDTLPPVELKDKLTVKVTASPAKVGGGSKSDLLVTFANISKEPLTLHFRIDPTPRFETEAFDAKGKRVDMPAGSAPPPPKGQSAPPASEPKSARVTLAPNGTARAHLAWDAVRTKWAPEKFRGTPPERGFPRSPAGPLGKGKYVVKVVTPLVGVSEGPEHDLSTPHVDIEVGAADHASAKN